MREDNNSYKLWLHGLCGLHEPHCLLSQKAIKLNHWPTHYCSLALHHLYILKISGFKCSDLRSLYCMRQYNYILLQFYWYHIMAFQVLCLFLVNGCPCGVWDHGLTTSPLYVGLFFWLNIPNKLVFMFDRMANRIFYYVNIYCYWILIYISTYYIRLLYFHPWNNFKVSVWKNCHHKYSCQIISIPVKS